LVHSQKSHAARISVRCRLIARPDQSYAAHSSAGAFTRWATDDTAGTGISPEDSGNRASTSKNFGSSANPDRFAPREQGRPGGEGGSRSIIPVRTGACHRSTE
jgi:hypothetical protein